MLKHTLLPLVACVGLFTGGCGVADHAFENCKPNPILPDDTCPGDAGVDGGDAGAMSRCAGECLLLPEDDLGALWNTDPPLQVWFGPSAEMPTECPYEGTIQFRLSPTRYL
jgi:hypothetical protein